jgi:hypothetical protein
MAGRGAYQAISEADAVRLVKAASDEELFDLLDEIYLRDGDTWHQDTDKAWVGIDRCFLYGVVYRLRDTPLQRCVTGGKPLQETDGHLVCYLEPDGVREVAKAIDGIDKKRMRRYYWQIDQDDYPFPLSVDDFEYVWCWFKQVKEFYRRAADAGRYVVFSGSW